MKGTLSSTSLVVLLSAAASSQTGPPQGNPPPDPQPIYRVTVVSRTLAAINYEHRSGPTKIDFQGTVLLPKAKGDATVESKRGRISIDVKFDHLEPPTKFGREYLTYVLWAITPQGRPKNLGEIVVGPSDKAKISVTTDLQALGLMVTAEPYYSVTAPSDVVVLENIVRPDTVGKVEEVAAKYDLLPRGQYTMNVNPNQLRTVGNEAEALPYDRYEAVLELYQAQNAIQIARSLGADHFAADTLSKAETLLGEAQDLQARKQDTHMIVSRAREAAQTAEDARMITVKRRDEDRLSHERQQDQDQSRVRTEAQESEDRAAADRSAAEAERVAAEQARAEAEQARALATQQLAQATAERTRSQPPAPASIQGQAVAQWQTTPGQTGIQRQTRANLLAGLNGIMPASDTPRGLVVVVPDSMLETSPRNPAPRVARQLAQIAALITTYPGLGVRVEGYSDDRGSDIECRSISQGRAQVVRDILVTNGVPAGTAMATGYGKDRPIASNDSAAGREQNRRVEIVIQGQALNSRP
ncbi:MAG TPA: OmpA family protein [Bryobacteraceae bacterium]|jgi:flagellar motor protein MotB|nr:OmpA family protein [Bryobacteraceae bacterium]